MILQGMGIGSFILAGFGSILEFIEDLIIGINRGLSFLAERHGPDLKAKVTETNPPVAPSGRFMPYGGTNPANPRNTGYVMRGR